MISSFVTFQMAMFLTRFLVRAESFYTIHDNQETMTIDVYEGERSRVKDNHLLGLFELTDIPKAARGDVEVRITYKVDANGMLEVTASLVGGNNAKTVVIEPESGRLSQQDIDRMVEEAERFAEDDEKARERIESRNTLESLAYDLTGKLETIESSEHVSASDKKLLADAIDDAMNLIDNGGDASAEDFKTKHSELQAISIPILRKANVADSEEGTDRTDMDDEL